MKRLLLTLIILLVLSISYLLPNVYAAMIDYCVVPPYVIQDVPPNVMIVLDNSGSMLTFAYFDGFTTPTDNGDNNDCTNSGSPCTGFTEPGTYPTYKYYGYFNPDYWYTYSSNRFAPAASKSAARPANSWDGNFLNWLTMRRVDVIRKVMTGGKTTSGEGSGYNRLVGEVADCDARGRFKEIANAGNYTPYGGLRTFTVDSLGRPCDGSGSGTSSFSVSSVSGSFNVAVRVPIPVEGVLQNVIGTRARLGLSFYRPNTSSADQGGYVQVYVTGASLSSTVNQINLTRPNANTPLAETLWEMVGYFAQDTSIVATPGPRYNPGDFQTNANVDPYNYGTGGQARYPSCAKSFILYITDGEPCADGYLPDFLRDYAGGEGVTFNCSATTCPPKAGTAPETYDFPASSALSCTGEGDSSLCNGVVSGCYVAGIEDVALYAHTIDLRSSSIGVNDMSGIQNLTLYTVYSFGRSSTLLKYASINGGFEDLNNNNKPDIQSEWDQNNDGEPDTYYEATDGNELEQALTNALASILKRAASGTAASVLASGEGRGANLVQAVFYPRRRFGNDIIFWTGENKNLWYYVDPFFANSNIREDTVAESPDRKLNLINDYIAQLYFDTAASLTKARRYQDTDGDGDADTVKPTVSFEGIKDIWSAGESLLLRNITTDSRTIYTTVTGTSLIRFSTDSLSTADATALRTDLQASDDTEAQYIIRYAQGEGLTTEDLDGDGIPEVTGIDRNADGVDDYRRRTVTLGSYTGVWKFGDVVNSTPRIAAWVPLNSYDSKYNDTSYKSFINSDSISMSTVNYKNRGMVFAGGNDGMLHAFKLGKLELQGLPGNTCTFGTKDIACLSGSTISNPIGKEMWAFIPKNALPYLKYMMDPDYCHVYTVDLSPYLFDASIGDPDSGNISGNVRDVSAWRTILIGGMRYGGACRNITGSCNTTTGGLPDCVKTPIDGVGYSSYFALDITDSLAYPDDPVGHPPKLLWEFSNDNLGFATTGPAVVRVGDRDKNGKWFVVFGSGPTGPISTTDQQFLGRSDQNMRLFVLDLKTGTPKQTIDTEIPFAFGGSMLGATNDPDVNYKDDVLYIGYVKRTGTSPNFTWTDGGVGRLITKESDPETSPWVWRPVIDEIGPVTASVAQLENVRTHTQWLFFGTGRYFYEQSGITDDADGQRRLFGIKEPCFSSSGFNSSCSSTVSVGALTNVSAIGDVPLESTANTSGFKGWYLNLESSGNYSYQEGGISVARGYKAERDITDPLATTAGLVFFTTYKPYGDECGIGGKSFIWAMRYSTGGSGGTLLKGTALLQVSTGSIEQVNLSQSLTEMGGRRTSALEGVPPTAQGLSLLSPPPPLKRTLHIKER